MNKKYRYNTIYVRREMPFVKKNDKRYKEYADFKSLHGFSPDECWNLDTTIMEFALPRLRYFRTHTVGYPSDIKTMDKWRRILDSMIFSFEHIPKYGFFLTGEQEKKLGMDSETYRKKAKRGIELFRKYFLGLWW